MVQCNNSTYLVIFIHSRLLVFIESLPSLQNIAIGVKFTLKRRKNTLEIEQSMIVYQPAFYPVMGGGHILDCTYLTLLQVSNFLLNNGNGSLYRGLLDLGCPILLGLGDNRRHVQACNTRLDD